jgi:pimeloyl-ACP methyl ester carboxylesterase
MRTTTQNRRSLNASATLLLTMFATAAPAADLMLQSGFVEHDGEQIYFESVGTGDPVVLSHGSGGNHAVWYQQVPVLAQHYRVVTWDQRGFGRSTNVKRQADPARAVQDLEALLAHLAITRAHLVGQSMGGWAVMGFALKHPERVRSLVLADTIAGVFTPEAVRAGESALRRSGPDQLPITQHPGLSDALGARDPAKAFLYRQIGGPSPAGMREKLYQTSYALDDIRRIRFPVLLIVGADDQTFPPAAIHSVAAKIRGATVVVLPDAGHSPYFETPDAWNEVVMNFLGSVTQP